MVALHAYTADADGELTLEKGDEITVTDEGDNSGWWKGDSHRLLHYYYSPQTHPSLQAERVSLSPFAPDLCLLSHTLKQPRRINLPFCLSLVSFTNLIDTHKL